MKTEITAVAPDGRVSFAIGGGIISANWVGPSPEIGKSYYVELAIKERMVLNVNLFEANEKSAGIANDNKQIVITATLESYDDDGAATLRLEDSLIQIEIEGPPPAGPTVSAYVNDLTIYDTNV